MQSCLLDGGLMRGETLVLSPLSSADWSLQSFIWPDPAQSMQDKTEQVTNQLGDISEQAAARLTALESKVTFNRHALSADAVNLLALRNQLNDLLCQGQIIAAHPYQFNADNSAKPSYHLSPMNAVNRLAEKFIDSADEYAPVGECYAVGIMIAEPNLATFARHTRDVFKVLALPELGMVSRRALAAMSLEQDKFTLPDTAQEPLFKPQANVNPAPLRQVLQWQGAQIAQLESIACDKQTPVDKLQALANKRNAQLSQWHDDIAALKRSDIQVRLFRAQGSPQVLRTLLQQSNVPGQEYAYTFTALLLSPTPLTFISELFA